MLLMASGSTSVKVSGLANTIVVVSSLTSSRLDTLGKFMKLNLDSIDLCRNDFLFAFAIPLLVIVLRLLPFSIFYANRSGYENRLTAGGR
jgi:hypothetical protein